MRAVDSPLRVRPVQHLEKQKDKNGEIVKKGIRTALDKGVVNLKDLYFTQI